MFEDAGANLSNSWLVPLIQPKRQILGLGRHVKPPMERWCKHTTPHSEGHVSFEAIAGFISAPHK